MTDSPAFSFCNLDQTSGIFLFKLVTKYQFLRLSVWFRLDPTFIPDKTLSDLYECHFRNGKCVHPDVVVVFLGGGGVLLIVLVFGVFYYFVCILFVSCAHCGVPEIIHCCLPLRFFSNVYSL